MIILSFIIFGFSKKYGEDLKEFIIKQPQFERNSVINSDESQFERICETYQNKLQKIMAKR